MNGTDPGSSDSMAPDVFVPVAFADRDDGTAIAALHQVATQKLGHSFQRGLADLPLHSADAVGREIADDATMAVKHFFAVVSSSQLLINGGMPRCCERVAAWLVWSVAIVFPWPALEGGQNRRSDGGSPSPTETDRRPKGQDASPNVQAMG